MVHTTRGRRGRWVETVAQLPPAPARGLRLALLGTEHLSGVGKALVQMGAKGLVSERSSGHRHSVHGTGGALQADTLARPTVVSSPPSGGDVSNASWAERNKRQRRAAPRQTCSELEGGEKRDLETGRERAVPDTRVDLEEDSDTSTEVKGPVSENVVRTDGTAEGPWIQMEGKGREEQIEEAEATSIATWVAKGDLRQPVTITLSDWEAMQELGMGIFPDLVVGLALRRCAGPSLLPTIRLTEWDGTDLPKRDWPTAWSDLVEHVRKGGAFRTTAVLRGGMDPSEAQRLLDATIFNGALQWEEIDRFLVQVRSGVPIPESDMRKDSARLAQALSGCIALQQWDALSTMLGTLPSDVTSGFALTPARLAALYVEISRRNLALAATPAWVSAASYVELRVHHLSPSTFGCDPRRTKELRGQLEDAITNRILSLLPALKDHAGFRLQDLRGDIRLEISYKAIQVNDLFSATLVLPTGPWIDDLIQGKVSMGGNSFCTMAPVDLYVETELSPVDQQVLRALRNALGMDSKTFRLLLNEAFTAACLGDARTREATVHFTSTGNSSRRTMEHVAPGSPESSILVTLDGTNLILARRNHTRLPLQLGPVTIGFNVMQCPHQAQQITLKRRDHASLRLRSPGSIVPHPVILLGPLPKGLISEEVTHSGARMADLRYQLQRVCGTDISTRDARLVGRYDKDRSPMFVYLEWSSAAEAQTFAARVDKEQTPQGFNTIMRSLLGDKQVPCWSCCLLAEVLAVADEKTLKTLMSHGEAHPCPLPPPLPPPPPPPPLPPPQYMAPPGDGEAAVGTGSVVGSPDKDNPAMAQH